MDYILVTIWSRMSMLILVRESIYSKAAWLFGATVFYKTFWPKFSRSITFKGQ